MSKSLERLMAYGVINKFKNGYKINKIFRETLITVISTGKMKIFQKVEPRMEVEVDYRKKWKEIYYFLLINVGTNQFDSQLNTKI